ncbi:exodeoxyribonuclease VII large subunit [soil metagenome]
MSLIDEAPAPTNLPAYSVSELAFALKRTLEDAYGHVRLRGEVSKITRHASGHVYLTIKDDKASIDGVIWKSVRGISVRPETGMEVIVSGRITTYPARSSYQLVIETLEPAGVGALLAQLERLKGRLADEGLFAAERKRPLPALPAVIGVVTSPTGAVIRDILHRLQERWPCRVIVWPVVVQGDSAAAQGAAAVRGFDALPVSGGALPRPDLIIVARGGGSVEDLWPFNDEALARTVAACSIPLISAVGHETDTTLIDFVSDRRAPTPKAAAEIATQVLADLAAEVADSARRMERCTRHALERSRERLRSAERGLPRPEGLLALASQRFDLAARGLGAGLARNVAVHEREFAGVGGRLNVALLDRPRRIKAERLAETDRRLQAAGLRPVERAAERARLPQLGARLASAVARRLDQAGERLARIEQLRRSLDPNAPLERGFARVRGADGRIVRAGAGLATGDRLQLQFVDAEVAASVEGGPAEAGQKAATPKSSTRLRSSGRNDIVSGQGRLF